MIDGILLIVPIDITGDSYPALLDLYLYFALWNRDIPGEGFNCSASDLVVGSSHVASKSDLDFLGHGFDSLDPGCGDFGGVLLHIASDVPGQRHDTAIRSHADMGGCDHRLP